MSIAVACVSLAVTRTAGEDTVGLDQDVGPDRGGPEAGVPRSIGAQEQIALISRRACATTVATDGGIPVIIDNALGSSDGLCEELVGDHRAPPSR